MKQILKKKYNIYNKRMKFICKVYHPEQNIILLNKEYDSLKALGEELGLSYNQVADLSCEKKEVKKYRKFKFYPKIEIQKVYKLSKEDNKDE
tara:strand:+ start:910 stop:1185 length:276 start_codon:yes stop_codon:yes gene_type:complete